MNERPRSPEGTPGASGGDRTRGQSDTIAIVLLLGMVFMGAGVVVITGGYLVDDVQGNSEHQLAVDSAVQTHQQIAEALQSGEARQLATSDAIDMRVQDSGHMSVEMLNPSSGEACSAEIDGNSAPQNVTPIETDLGSIVYETPQGEVIYEGGAIWEKTEGGVSIERAPPISYDGETARVSIQTVSADADDLEENIARPDEELQSTMVRNTTSMIRHCPAAGFTKMQISITSPYYEQWNQHFESAVAGQNVSITKDDSEERVVANISNATTPHASRGLRFANISAPDVVGDGANFASEFYVETEIANDGFTPRYANVTLKIDAIGTGHHPDNSVEVPPSGTGNKTVNFTTGDNGLPDEDLTWSHLKDDLDTSTLYDYSIVLGDSYGDDVSTVEGQFFLAADDTRGLTLAEAPWSLDDADDELSVNATLVNTLDSPKSSDVTFDVTDPRIDMDPFTAENVEVAKYGGVADADFTLDVSDLPAGIYDYQVRAPGASGPSLERQFVIANRSQQNLVGNLLVTSVEDSSTMVSTEGEFNVTTDVTNLGTGVGTGNLTLDVVGLSDVREPITLGKYNSTTETLELNSSTLEELDAGEVHNYTVSLTSGAADPFVTNGSFYLGKPGSVPYINRVTHSIAADGNVTINASVGNRGLENVSRSVNMTLADGNGTTFGPATLDVELAPGATQNVSFEFDASSLAGMYNYTVEFGRSIKTGTLEFEGIETDDGGVAISGKGNGTVTVLGTEIHDGDQWAPIGASVTVANETDTRDHSFNNTRHTSLSETEYGDRNNLNTYDTQDDTYEWTWSQSANETTTVTVGSTLWDNPFGGFGGGTPDDCDEGDDGGWGGGGWGSGDDGYQDVNGNSLPKDCLFESAETRVDAREGDNPQNVHVALDDDEVPLIPPAFPEQRGVQEILQNRVNDGTEPPRLDLASNEAVFFFELSHTYGDWQDALDNADDGYSSGVDFNDAIVLVEFTTSAPGHSVDFSVSNGSLLSINTTVPDSGNDDSTQNITGVDSNVDEDGGSAPTAPDAKSPDPGTPSQPDEIDLDVGGVVVG